MFYTGYLEKLKMYDLRLKLFLSPLAALAALSCFWFLKTPSQADSARLAVKLTSHTVQVSQLANSDSPQATFIRSLVPMIQRANQEILLQRRHLLKLQHLYQQHHSLPETDVYWLQNLADEYDVDAFGVTDANAWQSLVTRVDIIPPALAIAQAVEESQWGTSRFAQEANNYYGERCFSEGCGIIPANRPAGSHFEVQTFESEYDSVKSYLHTLNTHTEYLYLRQLRFWQRQNNEPISGLSLVQGLSHYSTRGDAYVQTIQHIIEKYQLQQYSFV